MELRDPPPGRTADRPRKPDEKASAPRDLDRVAQAVLRSVARSNLRLEERRVLAGYGRAVGLPASMTLGVEEAPRTEGGARALEACPQVGLDLTSLSVEMRLQVLRLMFRTAYANGRCNALELSVLRRIADAMGLTSDQFTATQNSIEGELRRTHHKRLTVGVFAIFVVVALTIVMLRELSRWIEPDDETRFLERIDRAVAERARLDAETIESTSAKLEQLERRIGEFIDERERATTTPPITTTSTEAPSGGEVLQELEALRTSLEKLKAQPDVFKHLESRYDRSVLLIMVAFDLVSGGARRTLTGYGTGFFVTSTGLILTNKHVVQPWKFEADVAELLDAGYRLDEPSVRMAAWPTGARVWKTPGKAIFSNAFNSLEGTLRVAATPPDEFEQAQIQRPDGRTYAGRLHAQNNSDLALLKAEVSAPVVPLPLASDPSRIEKLDPVMVLGFPSGPAMLESDKAETSPSLGTVRKVEDTVQVSAPIVQGNSGGPVIDLNGTVIGIATRTELGEATLGICIQSRYALALVQTAQ